MVGASAYMVAAAVAAMAEHRQASFDDVLNELLPAQKVADAPAAKPAAEPARGTSGQERTGQGSPSRAAESSSKSRGTASTLLPHQAIRTIQSPGTLRLSKPASCAGVKEFQQWMGDSHPVTGTGLPKRADIQDVAATIGIEAEGVAKKQDPAEASASDSDLSVPAGTQPTRYVQSAQAIPELMAFLEALQASELIAVLSTKVQPGARAQTFGLRRLRSGRCC